MNEKPRVAGSPSPLLITLEDAANRLAISKRTLQRQIARGHFPSPVKIGRILRVVAADLDAYGSKLGTPGAGNGLHPRSAGYRASTPTSNSPGCAPANCSRYWAGAGGAVGSEISDEQSAERGLPQIVQKHGKRDYGNSPSPAEGRKVTQKSVSEHVEAFLADLKAKGRSNSTFRRYRMIMNQLIDGCGWQAMADITASSFIAWRTASEVGPKFLNDQLGVARTFLNWMLRQDLILANPLERVEKAAYPEAGNFRRALSADEAVRLVNVAPFPRSAVYVFILNTGLRRRELNYLRRQDFQLAGENPHVLLPSKITKNKKPARIPLRAEAVDALQQICGENVGPLDQIFWRKVPSVTVLRRDLQSAGIPFIDDHGRRVDVHALRTTFGTLLSASGVAPQITKELMRHCDLRLTMRHYTDVAQLHLTSGLERLPSFAPKIEDTKNTQTTVPSGRVKSPQDRTGSENNAIGAVDATALSHSSHSEAPSVALGQLSPVAGPERFELSGSALRPIHTSGCRPTVRLRDHSLRSRRSHEPQRKSVIEILWVDLTATDRDRCAA